MEFVRWLDMEILIGQWVDMLLADGNMKNHRDVCLPHVLDIQSLWSPWKDHVWVPKYT